MAKSNKAYTFDLLVYYRLKDLEITIATSKNALWNYSRPSLQEKKNFDNAFAECHFCIKCIRETPIVYGN